MKAKQISALLLAALMSLSALTSCAENTEETAETASDVPAAESEAAAPEEEEEELYPYPEANFNGSLYRMLVRGPACGFWESNEMWVEESNGDVLNDAVYDRVIGIEDMYNVAVEVLKPAGSVYDEANKVVQAGQDEYQMILGSSSDVSSMATNHYALDLNTVDGLALDMPWWDQAANSGLSIAHKLYYTTGDISYDLYRATEAVLFNKQMLNEYNLEDPYTLVREGGWTFDKMLDMSQGVSADLDGNGVWDENDRYGMITYTNVVTSGIFASAIHYNTKDENDLPVLSFYSERTVSVVEDYISFMIDEQLCFDWAHYYHLSSDPNTNVGLVIFQENRGLFDYNGIHAVPNLRNMFSDFGIVPIPKYDEEQDAYYHCANNVACPFVVLPITNSDVNFAAAITDAFAHKGLDLVRVAFYDKTLKGKAARDKESAEMLDLIFSHMVYDIAFFNNFGGIGNLANDMMTAKTTDLASRYKSVEKVAGKMMSKFIDSLTEETAEG